MADKELSYNGSGYRDPTACVAISEILKKKRWRCKTVQRWHIRNRLS